MIAGFKLYAQGETLWCAFLEYGNQEGPVTLEQVTEPIKARGIESLDSGAIEQALQAGRFATVQVSRYLPVYLDGVCWLQRNEDGRSVTATVMPPYGSGRLPGLPDILREIQTAGLGELFILQDAILLSLDNLAKTGEPAVFEVAQVRDGEIEVTISNDKRVAHMSYKCPRGGRKPTREEVVAKLNEAGVVFGIEEIEIDRILEENRDMERQRIALAKDPVEGEDAKIKYLFDAYHLNVGPRIGEDDLADFRDLGLFENVQEGSALVERTPATPGEEGTDVAGQTLKPKAGRDAPLPKGKNTRVRDGDPNILEASIAGAPKLQGGKVVVEEVLTVGDVDFATGNIEFVGNVLVKGIVNPGFSITAGGDITCTDTVEGAHLRAGGSIYLKRGIKGQGKSVLEAGQDIYAHFIEQCTATAGRAIIVDEALIHSHASAVESVEAVGSKGTIFGGFVAAGNLIRANYLGSEMAIKTELEVGVAPHLRDRLSELNTSAKKKKNDLAQISRNLSALAIMRSKGNLGDKREKLYETLTGVTDQLKNEIEEMSSSIAELQKALEQCAEGRVEGGKVIYPGVRITIKNASRRIRQPFKKAVFVKEGPDVVLSTEVAEDAEHHE
jgi:hypothetical protein